MGMGETPEAPVQAGEEEFVYPQAALLHLNGDFSLVLLLCSSAGAGFSPGNTGGWRS